MQAMVKIDWDLEHHRAAPPSKPNPMFLAAERTEPLS